MSYLEQLQRQVDEFEALRATYPEWEADPCSSAVRAAGAGGPLVTNAASASVPTAGAASCSTAGLLFEPMEAQALSLARQICDAASSAQTSSGGGRGCGDEEDGPLAGLPLLSGTVRLPGLTYGGQPLALRFTLPRAYPGGSCDGDIGDDGGVGVGSHLHEGPASSARLSAGPQGPSPEDAAAGESGRAGEPLPLPQPSAAPPVGHSGRCAVLAVECAAPRHVHERLSSVVRRVAAEQAAEGCECLLLALDALKDAVEELAAQADDDGADGAAPAAASSSTPAAAAEAEAEGLLCCLIWLHHLKSLTKRKLIVQWARELRLAGACKPGFPGVVVVEGHSADVREFLARMRSLSWQAMQVRGEDLVPLPAAAGRPGAGGTTQRPAATATPTVAAGEAAAGAPAGAGTVAARVEAARRLRSPLPFVELEESGMSELGALCRAAGLHHVFLTALKL